MAKYIITKDLSLTPIKPANYQPAQFTVKIPKGITVEGIVDMSSKSTPLKFTYNGNNFIASHGEYEEVKAEIKSEKGNFFDNNTNVIIIFALVAIGLGYVLSRPSK